MGKSVDDYDPETELTCPLDALKNPSQRPSTPDTIKSYPSPSTESSSSLGLSKLDLDETKIDSSKSDLDETHTNGTSGVQGNNVNSVVNKYNCIISNFTKLLLNFLHVFLLFLFSAFSQIPKEIRLPPKSSLHLCSWNRLVKKLFKMLLTRMVLF